MALGKKVLRTLARSARIPSERSDRSSGNVYAVSLIPSGPINTVAKEDVLRCRDLGLENMICQLVRTRPEVFAEVPVDTATMVSRKYPDPVGTAVLFQETLKLGPPFRQKCAEVTMKSKAIITIF